MEKNFVIEDAVAVSVEGRYFDLHNLYDFKELRVEVDTKVVYLSFEINSKFKETAQTDKTLMIKFKGVDYFELSPNFVAKATGDLEEIGYKNPGDMDVDWLINDEKFTKTDHIFFRFGNDEFIRIHSKWALASVLTINEQPTRAD